MARELVRRGVGCGVGKIGRKRRGVGAGGR